MVLFLSEFIPKFLTVKWDALGWVDAFCTGACFQLLHPINASSPLPLLIPPPRPTRHWSTFRGWNTPRSRGKSFSFIRNHIQAPIFYFLLGSKILFFEVIINLIEIKMYFEGHMSFKDNLISLSKTKTRSKLVLLCTSSISYLLNSMWHM